MKLDAVIFSGPRPMPDGDAVSRTVRVLQTTDGARAGYVRGLRLDGAMVWALADDGRERAYVLGAGDQLTPSKVPPLAVVQQKGRR